MTSLLRSNSHAEAPLPPAFDSTVHLRWMRLHTDLNADALPAMVPDALLSAQTPSLTELDSCLFGPDCLPAILSKCEACLQQTLSKHSCFMLTACPLLHLGSAKHTLASQPFCILAPGRLLAVPITRAPSMSSQDTTVTLLLISLCHYL